MANYALDIEDKLFTAEITILKESNKIPISEFWRNPEIENTVLIEIPKSFKHDFENGKLIIEFKGSLFIPAAQISNLNDVKYIYRKAAIFKIEDQANAAT